MDPSRLIRRAVHAAAPDGVPVLRALGQWALARSLGAERPAAPREVTHPGDPGLTGPGSASWQVLSDVAGLPAGVRALLMQTLHPSAMAGVADHSTYAQDPFGRLHRTSEWVATATFGSTPAVLDVAARVRAIHARVVGTRPDGQPYAADDPDALTWVSITFTDSLLAADRAFAAAPVDAATADRFVLEQSRLSALLDPRVDLRPFREDLDRAAALRRGEVALPLLDEGRLPTDLASLRAVRDGYRHVLRRGWQADEALRFLRAPGLGPAALPTYRAMLRAAVATMPLEYRVELGWGWLRGPLADAAVAQTQALLVGLRLATGPAPALEAARRRVLATA